MNIQQFRYGADNLAYVVYGNKEAIAVDPGAVNDILSFVKDRALTLQYVVNTHTHPDHTTGNQKVLDKTGAEYIEPKQLVQDQGLPLEREEIKVYATPGHTRDSVVFHFNKTLVTGDTLFIGKAGKCMTGDFNALLESLRFLMSFPEDTVIYPGHDYVEEYMDTAKTVEPDNPAIDAFLKTYSPDHVVSTLADEYQMNPTLRFNRPELIEKLKERGLSVETEPDRFRSVMWIV